MQEGSAMGFDPLSVDRQMPWESRLFILYLLVVVTVSIAKSVGVVRALWLSKHASLQQTSIEDKFVLAWEECSNEVQSIKRWAFVTLFWTFFVVALLLLNELIPFAEHKMLWTGAVFATITEVLPVLVLGLLVCSVLYTVCALYEGALVRRKESRGRPR
jgi:hypothetical protein